MTEFEILLRRFHDVLDRFIKFKVSNPHDAEDIIQETCLTAYEKFNTLKNKESFKAWLIEIARYKCNEYYRRKANAPEISLESLSQLPFTVGRSGIKEKSIVSDTLSRLQDKDQQILYLYFFKELPQEEIAKRLDIPLGTVKSRLFYAKKNFKEKYPYPPKGENIMKKLPEMMPKYTIQATNLPIFPVKWEELMGWFIIPKLGEKLSWAMYDFPEKKRTESCYMQVIGKAEVHGIEGVEILATEVDPMECNNAGDQNQVERRFVAQLTDTHCRFLAESHTENGIKRYYTFLDGELFLNNWGFGEDNRGNEIHIAPKGDITRTNDIVTTKDKEFLLDIVGRYIVNIGGKSYDTVCVMDYDTYNEGAVSEQFIDQNGKTVLWRRFNKNDWAFARYGKTWSEMLPENEIMTVNGETYVHWYDCITDYIL